MAKLTKNQIFLGLIFVAALMLFGGTGILVGILLLLLILYVARKDKLI